MADKLKHQEGPTLKRNFSFHLLWSSTLASGFGDRMVMLIALAMLGINLTPEVQKELGIEPGSMNAAIEFFFWAPYVFWGPFAGWLADRVSRKWLMFFSDELRGLVILFCLTLVPANYDVTRTFDVWINPADYGLTFLPELTNVWKVYLMIFLIGMMAATFNPARTSIIPSVVGMKWLQAGNSIALSFGVIGNMIGFGVGGFFGDSEIRWLIFMGAAAYIVSGSVWPFLKTPYARHDHGDTSIHVEKKKFKPVAELVQGAQYIWQHRPMRSLTMVSISFWTSTAVVVPALAYLTIQLPASSPMRGLAALAALNGALGVGMLIGAFILGWMNTRAGSEILIVIGLIGSGISFAILIALNYIVLMLPMAFISGIFGGILLISITTGMQRMTPNKVLGRVIGARDMVSEILKLVVSLLIWQVAGSNQYMPYVMWVVCFGLAMLGIYGFVRFVMTGPFATGFHNSLVRSLSLYGEAWHRVQVMGKHYLPTEGAVIILSNHTCSVDPFLIQPFIKRPVRWVMVRTYKIPILNFFWKTINPIMVEKGAEDSAVVRQSIQALKEGQPLGLFPEGGINLDREQLMPFKSGIALIAKRSKAVIVPTFISGTPHTNNVYLAYLLPSKTQIHFGKPFTYEELHEVLKQRIASGELPEDATKGAKGLEHMTQLMKDRIEELRPAQVN